MFQAYDKFISKLGMERINALPFSSREIFFISYAQVSHTFQGLNADKRTQRLQSVSSVDGSS